MVEHLKPDLVFVVCPAPWLGVAGREAAIAKKVPLVFVEQFVEPGIVFAPGVRERIVETYRRASAAVAVGRANVEVLRGYGFPVDSVVVIPNSVRVDEPVERIRREEVFRRFAIPARECNAVAVARLHRHKGLDVLIEAVATLDAADRDRFHVVVFGEGEARSELESAIRRYALTDHIRLAGWYGLPREVIGAFDLFVLPSRNEGLPFAVLEAMAEGLPVITSDAGSAHEAVGDEQGGLVVPRENAPALRDALSRMIRDAEFRRGCGRVARENVRDYDAAANLRRLIDLWDAAYRSPYQDS
jgi:glycosyltransferase involved in cell wall biosynthesis